MESLTKNRKCTCKNALCVGKYEMENHKINTTAEAELK